MKQLIVVALILSAGLNVGCNRAKSEAEKNREAAQTWYEQVETGGNLGLVDSLMVTDVVRNGIESGTMQGREGAKSYIASLHAAFPDLKASPVAMYSDSGVTIVRYTMTGTQRGAWLGFPPTNRSFSITGIDIIKMSGGKITEFTAQPDEYSRLKQLGLIVPGLVAADSTSLR